MRTSLSELGVLYRKTLFEDVLPFWMEHGLDPAGGIDTCLDDDGKQLSGERWNWSQWRAVWVFSKLYNLFGKKAEWLDAATGIHRFVASSGPDDQGHWPLLLDETGKVKRGYESLYVDGFAIYGLVELYRATGDSNILESALKTFRAADEALRANEPPPAWPYPIPPGRMAHGMSMLFSLAFHELSRVAPDPEVQQAALFHHRQVMDVFLREDRGLVLEWLRTDGSEAPPPEGAAVCPGHAVESMWFQVHIALSHGDRETALRACDAILRHLEAGWDEQFGGLFLAVDADGRKEVGWPHHDTKLWWPHTEALYATLLGYGLTRNEGFLDWHERIREYAYAHFPDREHGEWRQKLDRTGKPIREALFLPVKDPFHLPRALIYCVRLLDEEATGEVGWANL